MAYYLSYQEKGLLNRLSLLDTPDSYRDLQEAGSGISLH